MHRLVNITRWSLACLFSAASLFFLNYALGGDYFGLGGFLLLSIVAIGLIRGVVWGRVLATLIYFPLAIALVFPSFGDGSGNPVGMFLAYVVLDAPSLAAQRFSVVVESVILLVPIAILNGKPTHFRRAVW